MEDSRFIRSRARFENLCWDVFTEVMRCGEMTPQAMRIFNAIYLLGRDDEKEWKRDLRWEKGYCD
jgi:hypothetical protein